MLLPSDVFDQPQPVGSRKIEFHISTDIPAAFKKDSEKEENYEEKSCGKSILIILFAEISFFLRMLKVKFCVYVSVFYYLSTSILVAPLENMEGYLVLAFLCN